MSKVLNHQRPKLKDVAQLAGTSTATASRAISGRGYIDEKTKQIVLQAAKVLNYQPNLQARNLRQQSNRIIGLIIPNLLNAYYTTLANSLSQLLYENGYHLWLSSTQDDPQIEESMLYDMLGYPVDGLIWVPTEGNNEALLSYLQDRHVPTVSLVRRVSNDILDTIVFEDIAGTQVAMQHLIDLGHRRIGYVGGDTRHSSNYNRWIGYQKALEKADISVDSNLIKLGSNWNTLGEMATSELLRVADRPTAIFIASNALMAGVLKTLRQYRLRIPEEMSIICFDDLDWFSFSTPPITAITHDHTKLARAAVDLLMKRIQKEDGRSSPPLFISIDFDLVLRKSTVPPASLPAKD
jgi:LacI family transcriptional regulator